MLVFSFKNIALFLNYRLMMYNLNKKKALQKALNFWDLAF